MPDIIVGSVGVQLVPSAKGFVEKTKGLLSGLSADVTLNAETTKARAELDEAAHDRESEIVADADTAEADAKLDHAARDRKSTIFADVAGGGLGGLATGIIGLGPALIPITAAVGGLVAALGAPLAAAGGGATIYGLIAGKAVKDTEKQVKALSKLQVGTKAYKDALAELSPAQTKFLGAQSKLKIAFQGLVTSAGGAVFGPLIKGMDALATILPKLAPVIKPVSKALEGLLGEVAKSAQNGALSDFIGFLSAASGPAIRDAGHFLGNIAVGFGQIFKAFAPVGASVTKGLLDWSKGFANVGQSKGLRDFVGYVQKVGPQVTSALDAIFKAVGHLIVAFAPIGGVVLASLKAFSNVISAIPTSVLGLLASGFIAAVVAAKAFAVVMGIVNVVMDANPISIIVVALAALVAGLVYAYTHFETFRHVVQSVFGFVKDNWPLLAGILLGPIGLFVGGLVDLYKHSQTFRSVVSAAFHAVGAAGRAMWNVLKGAFRFVVDAFLAMAGAIVHGAANAFGWIPGIGGKLKDAAKAFDHFRDQVNAILNGIHDKTVTVTINAKTHGPFLGTNSLGLTKPAFADGGTILGQRHPYADKVLMWGAPGEEVISNRYGQADRFRADRAAGRIPAYADGGTVTTGAQFTSFTGFSAASHALDGFINATNKASTTQRTTTTSLAATLKAATKDLNSTRTALQNLRQAASSLHGSVVQAFDPTSAFGVQGSWTDANGNDIFSQLSLSGQQSLLAQQSLGAAQSAGLQAQAFMADISKLSGRGFGGAALQGLASSGNLALADAIVSMSKSDSLQWARSFNQATRQTNQSARAISNDVYGKEISKKLDKLHDLEREVKILNAQVKHLAKDTGHAVGDELNSVAHKAKQRAGR